MRLHIILLNLNILPRRRTLKVKQFECWVLLHNELLKLQLYYFNFIAIVHYDNKMSVGTGWATYASIFFCDDDFYLIIAFVRGYSWLSIPNSVCWLVFYANQNKFKNIFIGNSTKQLKQPYQPTIMAHSWMNRKL